MSPPIAPLDDDQPVRLLRTLRDRFVLIYVATLLVALAFAPRFRDISHDQIEVDVKPGTGAPTDAQNGRSTPSLPPLPRDVSFTFPEIPSLTLDEDPIVDFIEPAAYRPASGPDLDLDAAAEALLPPSFDLWPSNAAAGITGSDVAPFDASAHTPLPAYMSLGTFGSTSGGGGGAGGGGGGGGVGGASTRPGVPPLTQGPIVPVPDVPPGGSDPGNPWGGSGGGNTNTYQTTSQPPSGGDGGDGGGNGPASTNPPVSVPEPGAVFFAALGATVILTRRLRTRAR